MKKQISLMALIAIIATFVAFSGVVSAQANVRVLFFESPYCGVCKQMEPIIASLQAKNPQASVVKYDVTTAEGRNAAKANGVPNGAGTPVIVILAGGSQVYYHETTLVDEATLQAVINQYTIKPVVQPTQQPKITPSPIKLQATASPMSTTTPPITVEKKPQTVPEFSIAGLGIPALIVGAIYLFVRRN